MANLNHYLQLISSIMHFILYLAVNSMHIKCESNQYFSTVKKYRIFSLVTDCGRPWPAAYINIIQNTHQIRVLTEALCRAQAIFYSLPNNEWGTKYRGLTYSAK